MKALREAPLQPFFRKLKQKNFFNENEYNKMYSTGSAPARNCRAPKMRKFSSCDLFPKLRPIILSIGTFNYNLAHFLCDLLLSIVPNDYLAKTLFLLFIKSRMQIFPENFFFLTIQLVFKNYFSYKDPIPDDFKSFLVYKFTCASCSFSYISKTCHHFKTRIEEHIKKDNKSHIFRHLHSTSTCFDSSNSLSFKIINQASSKFYLKIKEALHINLEKPYLKSFISHPFAIYSVTLVLFFCLFVLAFLFHLLFLFSLTLIISILVTLRYYFISLQHTSYLTFLFHLLLSVSLS